MAGLFFGLVVTALVPAAFEARTTLVLSQPPGINLPGVGSDQGDPERFVGTQADVAESAAVLLPAAESVGLELSADQLRDVVSVDVVRDTDVVEIRAVLDDEADAVMFANAVAEELDALITGRAQQTLEEVRARLVSQREQLVLRLAEVDTALAAAPSDDLRRERQIASTQVEAILALELAADLHELTLPRLVSVIEAADESEQVFPSTVRFAAAGAVLSFLLVLMIAWWRMAARQAAPDHLEIERTLGVPILAAVPFVRHGADGPRSAEPNTPEQAAFRLAGSVLRRQMDALDVRSVLITSPSDHDGKSTATLNLASATMAIGGQPLIARWDRAATGPLGEPRRVVTGTLELDSVTIGPDQLHGRAFIDLLSEVDGPVLVDGPSMDAATEVRRLATSLDGLVIVIREPIDQPTLARIARFLATFEQPAIGLVVFESRPG